MSYGDIFDSLLDGLGITVQVTVLAVAWGTVAAIVLGVASLSSWWSVRAVVRIWVEVFRGVSAIILMFWVYYSLPLLGVELEPLTAGVLALGLNTSAYGAEIVRGAVQSVPRAQYEGAMALSLTPAQRMRRVILPQAVVEMLPPFNTLFIQLLKSTALLSLVAINEITNLANQRLVPNFQPELPLVWLVVLVLYLLLALVITTVMRLLESAAAARLGRKPSARARTAAKTTAGVV